MSEFQKNQFFKKINSSKNHHRPELYRVIRETSKKIYISQGKVKKQWTSYSRTVDLIHHTWDTR
jgi:hypothetical protein